MKIEKYVFTPNAHDFVSGLLSGSSLILNILGIIHLQKRKIKDK